MSYLSAAVAYLALTLMLLTRWRGRIKGIYLLLPVLVIMVWSSIIAWFQYRGLSISSAYILVVELSKSGLWALLVIQLLSIEEKNSNKISKYKNFLIFVISIEFLCLLVEIILNIELTQRRYLLIGNVVLTVFGLMLLEQFYRNSSIKTRWGLKYICVGLGGLFLYDFYLFSDAMLYGKLDNNIWFARGYINAIFMPIIAIGIARNKQWPLDLFVSRRMVFYTATLIFSGIYLVTMAAGGYYINYIGGERNYTIQFIFIVLALLVLVVILFSGQLRSFLRVFINKHFFSYKYDYREQWLGFTNMLSTAQQSGNAPEVIMRAFGEIVESPAGVLWLLEDSGSYHPVASYGQEESKPEPLDKNDSIILFIKKTKWVVNLNEYRSTPSKYKSVVLTQAIFNDSSSWLLIPLFESNNLIGVVMLAQSRVNYAFNWEDSDLLKTAGSQAATYLVQQKLNNDLIVARQFEAFNQFSTYIIHDIKNMVAQLSLMVSNSEKHKGNPEFVDDMIETARNSVNKMELLISQLRTGGVSIKGLSPMRTNLGQLIISVLEVKKSQKPLVQFSSDYAEEILIKGDPDQMQRILDNLIQNALDASSLHDKIHVQLSKNKSHAILIIQDTGMGMDEQFLQERLFKPFDTTKGSDGMGIGAYQSRDYIRQLGGSLEVKSEIGVGSTFIIEIPLFETEENKYE